VHGRSAPAGGIKRDSLYRLIREGRVRSTKIGERRLILRQSLLELDRVPA
jgi:excisionase family DNA binding protein